MTRTIAAVALGLCVYANSHGAAAGSSKAVTHEAARHKAVTHTVAIEAMRFQPAVLTINAADTVIWINKDAFPHTATSKAGGFDSREIQAEKSWKYTAPAIGEFTYVCTLHPTMKGTLVVRAQAAGTN